MDELIIRSLMNETTAEEERQLMRWRAARPENDARYRALSATWELAGHGWNPPSTTPPTAAEIIRLAAEEGTRTAVPTMARRRRRLGRAARVTALAAGVAGAVLVASLIRDGGPGAGTQDGPYTVAASRPRTVQLADGSVAHLAPGSSIAIDPGEPRSATLTGRAYFGIQHDPDQPFIVRSAAGETRVLGTRFDMTVAGDELTVVVVEGRVEVVSDSGSAEAGPGELTRVVSGGKPRTTRADVDAITEWLGNVFIFQATPLATVAGELEARFDRRIIIEDPELRGRTVTAVFADRSLDEILPALCRAVDVRCVAGSDGVHLTN